MKQKNKAKSPHRRKYYFALVLALLITVGYAALVWYSSVTPIAPDFYAGVPIFYPSIIIAASPVVFLVVVCAFLACVWFAGRSGAGCLITGIALLTGSVMLLSSVFVRVFYRITPVQHVILYDDTYRLLIVQQGVSRCACRY